MAALKGLEICCLEDNKRIASANTNSEHGSIIGLNIFSVVLDKF